VGLQERFGFKGRDGPDDSGVKDANNQIFKDLGEAPTDDLRELKESIHTELIERIDYTVWESLDPDMLREQVKGVVKTLLDEHPIQLSDLDKQTLIEEIKNETLGLGPIERYLHDPFVSDILVNTYNQVYLEKNGKLELTNTQFRDDAHLLQIIDRIVSQVGRRIDESSPMVDARLPDGSRVNAIIPPLALDGPILSIRRFGVRALGLNDLLEYQTLSSNMAELLRAAVKVKLNILISGGTGSGKTTLLNTLSSFIPPDGRIITIEDAAELKLQQPHTVRLETRPPNIEGKGEITQRDLVRNALRMRPDRIVVGEVRGPEVMDMLQAMNTGHEGSLTTLHSNSPRDALARLETLMLLSGFTLPEKGMREQICSALDLIIQVARMSDGSRKVTSLTEIVGMEGDIISSQDIFVFEKSGINEDGDVVGEFKPTGICPRFHDRFGVSGINLPDRIYGE